MTYNPYSFIVSHKKIIVTRKMRKKKCICNITKLCSNPDSTADNNFGLSLKEKIPVAIFKCGCKYFESPHIKGWAPCVFPLKSDQLVALTNSMWLK